MTITGKASASAIASLRASSRRAALVDAALSPAGPFELRVALGSTMDTQRLAGAVVDVIVEYGDGAALFTERLPFPVRGIALHRSGGRVRAWLELVQASTAGLANPSASQQAGALELIEYQLPIVAAVVRASGAGSQVTTRVHSIAAGATLLTDIPAFAESVRLSSSADVTAELVDVATVPAVVGRAYVVTDELQEHDVPAAASRLRIANTTGGVVAVTVGYRRR